MTQCVCDPCLCIDNAEDVAEEHAIVVAREFFARQLALVVIRRPGPRVVDLPMPCPEHLVAGYQRPRMHPAQVIPDPLPVATARYRSRA